MIQTTPPMRLLILGLACLLPAVVHGEERLAALTPFLEKHCFECHGPEKQKNDVRLDTLGHDLTSLENLRIWQDVLDQLNLGEMPPRKQVRPGNAESAKFIEALTSSLRDAYANQKPVLSEPVIRRLNRIELRNTLRDLLYLEQPVFRNLGISNPEDLSGNGSVSRHSDDPIREFPPDELEEGLDNIGSRLVMSDFLLELLIGAAEESLAFATAPEAMPELVTHRFAGHIRTSGPGGMESESRRFNPDYDVLLQRYREPGAATSVGIIAPSKIARSGVGVSARYRITVEASAHNQKHPWGELIRSRQDEPMLLGLHLADCRRGAFSEGNPNVEKLTEWVLTGDGQRRSYTFEGWIDARWVPRLVWENAPYERGLTAEKIVQRYRPQEWRLPPAPQAGKKVKERHRTDMVRALFAAGYAGPHIRIHSLTLEPLVDSWPPRSRAQLYGKTASEPIPGLIRSFANRAWRRPVHDEEVSRYVVLAEKRLAAGASRDEALRVAYTALLVSPGFYYLRKIDGAGDYNLASKLSYFLWSSMPDEELFSLAATGRLSDPAVRRAQVNRMLAHRNVASFVRRFTERWLRLDRLGSMPPPGGFYFHRQMEDQMRKQTDAYFLDLIRRNGAVRDIVESDYTFLNERTAQWIYKRDDVWGDAFRKVPAMVPHGGGMLTMPAVMTATANGVDTSPVVRGVWMLESVLGTPPAPPPPGIQPLSPDLRGASTIREQLEAHRAQESCKSCHQKIDPYGFAFENFDELGIWRTHYQTGREALPIDPSSVLADGRKIAGIDAMKQFVLTKEEQVARHLTGKMLAYAAGRTLGPRDRGEVDRIVAALKTNGYRVRDLIHHVAESSIFLP